MTSIQEDVLELQSLNNEIKKYLMSLRSLRKKVVTTQQRIQEYLDIKELPGIKYKGFVVMRNPKPIRQKKKKEEQLEHSIEVFKKYDIKNPEIILKEILEARKGPMKHNNKLIFKNIKE